MKKNDPSSRYLDFCVLVKSTDFMWRHHRHCYITKVTLILSSFNPKYYQNEIWGNKWNTVKYYCVAFITRSHLAVFNSWHLPFLNAPYTPFQKNERLESWLINYWVIEKDPERSSSPPNCWIGHVWWLNELWSKNAPCHIY